LIKVNKLYRTKDDQKRRSKIGAKGVGKKWAERRNPTAVVSGITMSGELPHCDGSMSVPRKSVFDQSL
jgi:hypothetical protein